ncbi:MAG: cob(I)yrinic acid a,c-diamide adenosyltransferase [Candidatus Micrarchaeales archaeon]|uniref:ATP--cobalamin adenosyltransferase n=1 Tax=Candidatus Micrarchaeum acidiphilum ARMAN-2 TaxID=425595 RepID=C7DGS9_MICA2|nr:MAG: ATP--cobalamin adenosyltransferase [Candidatus Micrarchaeum acidiphilum ARMAN-2]MCW6161522.1 cob(I)yrinic acid a,c-diamide adenosyltransferase [Candidatus Micrarchaeales archaeon]
MTKFYTGVGDSGKTAIGGRKLSKGELIFEAVGDIDELNSVIGIIMSRVENGTIKEVLSVVQNRLFGIGAEIAATIDPMFKPKRLVSGDDTKALERYIAELSNGLGEIREFVLPGGTGGAEFLDLGRAVARRAERSVVRLGAITSLDPGIVTYLNRLSSLLFVAARRVNIDSGFKEKHPDYS